MFLHLVIKFLLYQSGDVGTWIYEVKGIALKMSQHQYVHTSCNRHDQRKLWSSSSHEDGKHAIDHKSECQIYCFISWESWEHFAQWTWQEKCFSTVGTMTSYSYSHLSDDEHVAGKSKYFEADATKPECVLVSSAKDKVTMHAVETSFLTCLKKSRKVMVSLFF